MAGLMNIGKAMPDSPKGVANTVGKRDLFTIPELPMMKDIGSDPSLGGSLAEGRSAETGARQSPFSTPPTEPGAEGQPPETGGGMPAPSMMEPGATPPPSAPPMPAAPSSGTAMGPGTFLRPGQAGGGARAAMAAFRSPMFGMGGQPEMRFGPGSPLASTGESMTFADAEGGGKNLEDILAMLAQGGGVQ